MIRYLPPIGDPSGPTTTEMSGRVSNPPDPTTILMC